MENIESSRGRLPRSLMSCFHLRLLLHVIKQFLQEEFVVTLQDIILFLITSTTYFLHKPVSLRANPKTER